MMLFHIRVDISQKRKDDFYLFSFSSAGGKLGTQQSHVLLWMDGILSMRKEICCQEKKFPAIC